MNKINYNVQIELLCYRIKNKYDSQYFSKIKSTKCVQMSFKLGDLKLFLNFSRDLHTFSERWHTHTHSYRYMCVPIPTLGNYFGNVTWSCAI